MREGVNKVALRLFEHNEKAYHAAVRMMEQYGKAAIVHPTGTGKSYIAFKLIEDNPEKVVIWLSPSEYIFKTQLESLKRNDPDFPLANVLFYTYAKLMCCTQAQLEKIAAQKPAYIILDEFHRAGAECWGESTVALLKLCPDAKLLGLTATNIRYLDNNRDMAEELFDSRVASNMTLGEAVVRGILPAPKYVTTVYQYQKALAKYQVRVDNLRAPGIQDVNQKYLDALRRALEQADGLDLVFQHHITQTSGKYIVFCANKEHMDEMISHVPEWFSGVNPDVVVYEAYSDDPNTDKAFADFKTDTSDRLKLLFCIDMLNEGIHVDDISGVILLRPTVSPIVYKQQIGRSLSAGKTAEPVIFDIVNNFENLYSIGAIEDEMKAAITYYRFLGENSEIVQEHFKVIDEVRDCKALFDAAAEAFGRVDVLVNNAGITRDNLILRLTEQDFDAVLDTNLKSAFLCCKEAARRMVRQRYGRIVNLSSVVALRGNAGQTNYAASKAGLIGLTKSLARELAARNVTVNAVAPGFIDTDMTAVLPEAVRTGMTQGIPAGRAGQPEDVAQAVAFFAAEQSSYLTGQVLCVDGGMAM